MPEQPTSQPVTINPRGGVDVSRAGDLLELGVATDALAIDFDEESAQQSGGARKMLARPARRPGVLTTATTMPMHSAGGSSPARGYAFFGYAPELDLGGDFADDGVSGTSAAFHVRRQNKDAWNVSLRFRLPEDSKLFDVDQRAAAAPAAPGTGLQDGWQFDEALDHCVILWQKGGDRTSPLSAFIGIVNVGTAWEGMGGAAGDRPSNYAICFGWLDAPSWGRNVPGNMRYKVGTGAQANVGTTGSQCTLALRVIAFNLWVEPGEDYALSFGIQLDSGSPHASGTATDPTASWAGNGAIRCSLSALRHGSELAAQHGTPIVWKGPTDSIEYLKRYGVRYSGRDATFLGLGMRNVPRDPLSWPAVGFDAASMENGGHRMAPIGDLDCTTLGYAFNADHAVVTDQFLVVSHQGFNGVGDGGESYHSPDGDFSGIYDGAAYGNLEALRGYYFVLGSTAPATLRGVRLRLDDFEEVVGPAYRFNLLNAPASFATFSAQSHVLQCLRWLQVPVVFDELTIYGEALDQSADSIEGAARRFVLASGHDPILEDPDVDALLAVWPLDDGEAGRLRELVGGRDGALVPYAGIAWGAGSRGKERLFLSGEGDALVLDLSEDPVFVTEVRRMMEANEGGVAVQVTMTIPEAHYAGLDGSSGQFEGTYAPTLLAWETREADAAPPLPLMRLTHRARTALTERVAFWGPQGLTFEVLKQADQQADDLETIVTTTTAGEWAGDSPWVGQSITLQVGIEATGVADQFRCYLAVTPKELFLPVDGEPGGLELVYHETLTLSRRELVRSLVTIGGQFHPRGASWSELGCRLWIDEVHVLAAPAPGALAATGTANLERDGKLVGGNALPSGDLGREELLFSLGASSRAVSVTRGSRSVSTPSSSAFWTGDAAASLEGLAGTFLAVRGDELEVRQTQSVPERFTELYQIVSATASTITLRTPYNGPTRAGAAAAQVRHVGYTAFRGLAQAEFAFTIGAGAAYDAASTAEDAILTGPIVPNLAPFGGEWRLRLYRLAESALEVRPRWVRGARIPARNPISGATALGGELFCGAGAALYRVDGRWRAVLRDEVEGWSLGFLGREEWPHAPLDGDVALGAVADGLTVSAAAGDAWAIEAEVTLDEVGGLQSVAWCGDPAKHPRDADTTAFWFRFHDGRPELAVGSTETFDGTDVPERGLYVATAQQWVRAGVRTLVRFEVESDGALLLVPRCWINGAEVTVTVAARGNGLGTTEWLTIADLVAGETLALGAARDWPLSSCRQGTLTVGVLSGQLLCPVRRSGWMHSLRGALAGFWIDDDATPQVGGYRGEALVGDPDPSFSVHVPLGTGHGAELSCVGVADLVFYANPFLGITYEHGDHGKPWTLATWGNRVFATAGGRPVVFDARRDLLRPVGMLRPATKPTFEVRRRPLWVPNIQDATAASDPFPVLLLGGVQDVDASEPNNHYSTFGNAYLEQASDEPMRWERDDAGATDEQNDILAFKCLFLLRSVAGRNVVLEARSSTDNGSFFLEVRDGRLVFGWYDTERKEEALIEVDGEVVEPGTWYYLFLKKLYPKPSETGWDNSIWAQGTNVHRDMLVLRRFVVGHNPPPNDGVIDVKPTTGAVDWAANTRHCISFTTLDAVDTHASFTAKGRVTGTTLTIDITPTSGNAGSFAIGASSYATPFHSDMHGMLIQWYDGAKARLGRITRCLPAGPTFLLETIDGLGAPDAEVDVPAAVCIGVKLVLNDAAQSGVSPDSSLYPIRVFGSALAGSPYSGIQPVSAEFGSFGWVVIREDGSVPGAPGSNPLLFHNSASAVMEIGTDTFAGGLTGPATAPPGNLVYNSSGVNHTVVQSSQPNDALEVELDGTVSAIGATALYWRLLQPVQLLDGARRFSVTFYDPETDAETGPSPELLVDPSADDTANGSAQSSILLRDLPVSPDGDWVQRRIYTTLADGVIPQLVATVPDNVSTEFEIDVDDGAISTGLPQRQFQRPPLRVAIVAVVTNRLVLAAPADNEDLLWYSEAYSPDRFPIDNFAIFATGPRSAITGIAEFGGRAIVAKRNRYIASVLLADGAAVQRTISDSRGCVAHNTMRMVEDSLVWVDSSGLCAMQPGGTPRLISPALRDLFRSNVKRSSLEFAAAGVSMTRRQYVVALEVNSGRRRITAEMRRDTTEIGAESTSWRFGFDADPDVTAMTQVDDAFGGPERLIGFDVYGFAYELDVRSTALVGSGELVELSAAEEWGAVAANDLDRASLVRGQKVRVGDSVFTALATDGERLITRETPVAGVASIGAKRTLWASQWLDFDAPSMKKEIKRIDLHFDEDSTPGYVRVRVYRNRSEPALCYEKSVSVSAVAQVHAHVACAQHIQIVIDRPVPVADQDLDFHFEITKIVCEISNVDAR